VLVDVLLVCVAALDAATSVDQASAARVACAAVASLALALRRRLPYLVFALTVLAAALSSVVAATLIALYTVANRTRNRPALAACTALAAVSFALPWPSPEFDMTSPDMILISVAYAAAMAAAPAFLGQLVQTRQDLSAQLTEIRSVREHEQHLVAQTVLAKERAQLSREMHDVVSHQVSLIAVRAGALQMSTKDHDAREAATTIRHLSVTTLDELRHMVTLLRASATLPTELAPQPTLAELGRLVANSGVATRFAGELPTDIPLPHQRAIYRTVQEALTNARKHAPGATVTIQLWHDEADVGVTVTNTSPTRPTIPLPSAQHGLIGLRERAELLGGHLTAGATAAGGFQLRVRLSAHQP
jgi:signal transduction histidine kinase